MRTIVAIAFTLLALTGCTRDQQTESRPVVTTADVPQNPAIIARFTDEIWPVMNQYSPDQAGMTRLSRIVDPNLPPEALNGDIGAALINMLRGSDNDYRSGPKIVNVSIDAMASGVAKMNVCYAYGHTRYQSANDLNLNNLTPESSEVNIALAQVNNVWYLHSITNDHVVPDCQSSKA